MPRVLMPPAPAYTNAGAGILTPVPQPVDVVYVGVDRRPSLVDADSDTNTVVSTDSTSSSLSSTTSEAAREYRLPSIITDAHHTFDGRRGSLPSIFLPTLVTAERRHSISDPIHYAANLKRKEGPSDNNSHEYQTQSGKRRSSYESLPVNAPLSKTSCHLPHTKSPLSTSITPSVYNIPSSTSLPSISGENISPSSITSSSNIQSLPSIPEETTQGEVLSTTATASSALTTDNNPLHSLAEVAFHLSNRRDSHSDTSGEVNTVDDHGEQDMELSDDEDDTTTMKKHFAYLEKGRRFSAPATNTAASSSATSSSTSTKGIYARSPQMKVTHKIAERQRRQQIKELFDDLKNTMPNEWWKASKASKWEVLSRAIEYIDILKADRHRFEAERNKVQSELDDLKKKLVGVHLSSNSDADAGSSPSETQN